MSPGRNKAARGARAGAAAAAAPGALVSSGPEANPALALCSSLGLLLLLLLPLFGGGYSGAGYQLSFVLLPLALSAGLWVSPLIPRPALYLLALYLGGLFLLPLWLAPGQLLWYYVAQIPLAWCWCWVLLSQSPTRARWLLPVISIAAGLTALYGCFLWYGAGTIDYQISSSFGLHNPYGGYLLLAWPCALLASVQAGGRLARLCWALLALLLLATLFLTHSQGCIAALGLQVLILLLWWLGGLRQRRSDSPAGGVRALPPLAVLGGAAVLLAGLLALAPVRDTLVQLFDFGGYSMQGRLRFWSAALAIFRDHLAGLGPGSFAYVFPQYQKDWVYYSVDPHSWELQLLAELGLPGALILLAVLAGLCWWLLRLWRGAAHWLPAGLCAAAVLGSLAHASIDFDYTFSAVTMLLGTLLAYGSFVSTAPPAAAEGTDAAPAQPAAAPSWLRWLCIALLLGMAYWGQRLSLERFVLDALRGLNVNQIMAAGLSDEAGAQAAAQREDLLRSAIRYNPHNYETRYRLAYSLAPSRQRESLEEARALADSALRLNPRFTQAWALAGLLAADQQGKDEKLGRAIELDPYNFPEHYFYWAQLAATDAQRRERLLLGMQRIPVNDPIPPDHVRPQWHSLNPTFGQWWDMLARLSEDPAEKRLYEERAKKFKDYVIAEREKRMQQGH